MAKADFYLYIKAKPAANTELLCFFLTLKLYGWKSNLLLGRVEKNTIVLKQNSNSSIRLCRVVFGENTFSSELKGKTYKAIIGFFHKPSDNPFSFDNGYFIAFQSTYLQEENMFVIIGFGFNGTIENKFLALK